MSNRTLMKFTGGKELAAALRELPKAVGKRATLDALKTTGTPVLTSMQRNAPKDTGEGAASISMQSVRIQGYETSVAIGPDKDHFYLMFPEFGTSKLPARPWARPAWDEVKDVLLKNLGSNLWQRIAAAARRVAKRSA